MPESIGRRRAVPVAVLVAALFVSILPSVAVATAPPGLEPFLYALGQVESGGSYTARNATSGAYGKYQIMPASWAGWAKLYLGSSTAPQTPANQEIVAHRKVTALYNWLDAWPTVAHWWLTGSSERNSALWSSFSRTYVNRVMTVMANAPDTTGDATAAGPPPLGRIDVNTPPAPATLRLAETSRQIAYRSTWSTASYGGYVGDRVRYATRTGASATVTFTGRSVAWIGPVGPTRGTARVYIDGKAVATISLRRSTFKAQATIFSKTFATSGRHTLRIVVTSAHRPVAIDEIVIKG